MASALQPSALGMVQDVPRSPPIVWGDQGVIPQHSTPLIAVGPLQGVVEEGPEIIESERLGLEGTLKMI